MRRLVQLVLALALCALMAAPAWAQQQGRGQRGQRGQGGGRGQGMGGMMGPMMLLGQKSVQEDLKMTDEQVEQAAEANKKMMASMRGRFQQQGQSSPEEREARMREMRKEQDKTVAEILKPEQVTRIKQIQRQVQGARAMSDPEVVSHLNLTDDQKQKLQEIQDESGKEMAKLRENRDLSQGEQRERREELTKSANEKVQGVLTDEQKTKWKEMTGEPFKGKLEFGPPGGGRGGRPERPI